MTIQHGLRFLVYIGVLEVLGAGLAAGVRASEVHHGAWTSAPCCVPNAGGFGYFATRWRQWPTETRLDQDLPQAVGRTPVPAPAPLRAAPEGRPGLPPELPAPPMPPAKPAAPTGDRAPEPKPPAAKGTPPATVPQQAPAVPKPSKPPVPKPSKEEPPPQTLPSPKALQGRPTPKVEPEPDAELPAASPAASPRLPPLPSPPPALKPEPKASSRSGLEEPPLPAVGQDRPGFLKPPPGASLAWVLGESQGAGHGLAGEPPSSAERAVVTPPSEPAGQAIRQAAHLALGTGRAISALEGFCPVELVRNERWVPGDARYAAEYRGRVYFLSGPAQHQEFLANPERYVPSHSGIDPVTLVEGSPVTGKTDYCAVYDGRLYMFSSPETLARFRQDPRRYASQLPPSQR